MGAQPQCRRLVYPEDFANVTKCNDENGHCSRAGCGRRRESREMKAGVRLAIRRAHYLRQLGHQPGTVLSGRRRSPLIQSLSDFARPGTPINNVPFQPRQNLISAAPSVPAVCPIVGRRLCFDYWSERRFSGLIPRSHPNCRGPPRLRAVRNRSGRLRA
jgi:hypothetical protein